MSNQDNGSGELILTDAEVQSQLWIRIEQYLAARLERLRARNDGPLSPEDTYTLRGEIRAVKNLLAAGEDRD